jgi:hypothetical protein
MATFSQMRTQGMQNVQNLLAGGTQPAPAQAPAPAATTDYSGIGVGAALPAGFAKYQQDPNQASGIWENGNWITGQELAQRDYQNKLDIYNRNQQAAAAQQAKQAADLRGTITGTIGNLQNVYNQLYGDIAGAAQSQRDVLEKRFGRETGALGEQFTSEFPKIGRAYAARGAYSSSYRQDAQEAAQRAFQRQLEDIKMQREQDAANIGQFLAREQGKIQAEQGILGKTLGQLGKETDINQLTQLRNTIDRQIADVQAQRAGTQSQEAYLQRFQTIAPASDRLANLQATLTNIIQGAAPGAVKQQVANQIIGSAGLSPQEEEQLRSQITQQLG